MKALLLLKAIAVAFVTACAMLLLSGCTAAELERANRAFAAATQSYYATPAPEPRVWINPPGAPFHIYPPQ